MAILDTHLRVQMSELGSAFDQIRAALTISNPEWEAAVKEMLWSAQTLPRTIELFHVEGDTLVLPRGFYSSFLRGMQASGIEVAWEDHRRWYEFMPITGPDGALSPIDLRDYQRPAVEAMVSYEQGTLKMPTGGGKTACSLEALRRVDQPTLIVVDRAALAEQWVDQIREKLGYESGYFGEDRVDVRMITVALRQSLWARYDELERPTWSLLDLVEGSFWDLWGTLILDEDHHVGSAGTLQDLISRFPARYRWGVSATPDRDPAWYPVSQAVVGPILHETTIQDAADSLVIPSVCVLSSDFEFDYHPTYFADQVDPNTGEKVISPRTGKPVRVRVQNNYADMMKELCTDPERNAMISEMIVGEMMSGHKCLVVSRRKEHLRAILCAIEDVSPEAAASCVLLTGENSGKQARDIAEHVAASPYVCVLSTIADEALDLPSLDRGFLPYPARNPETVKQIIGRIMRPAPGKTEAIFYDVRDKHMGLLNSQFRGRAQMYAKMGFRVDREATTA